MNKIQVIQPTFLINLDNPTEVSYVPMEGNWKSIIVQTYQHGFPEIKDDEILYVYKENRGYIKKQVMNKEIPVKYNGEIVGYTTDEGKTIQFNDGESLKKVNELLTQNQTIWVSSRAIGKIKDDNTVEETEKISYDISHFGNTTKQQIIDEVYENYVKSFFKGELKKNYEGGGYDIDDYYYSIIDAQHLLGWPQDGPVSKKEFIDKCKTDPEFSETWKLKIEERVLSRKERGGYYYKHGNIEGIVEGSLDRPIWENDETAHKWYDERNVPTKLITLTYNNETIESYE